MSEFDDNRSSSRYKDKNGGYTRDRRADGSRNRSRNYDGQSYGGPGYDGQNYGGQNYGGQGYNGQNYGGPVNDGRGYSGPANDGRSYGGPGYDGRNYGGQGYNGQNYGAPANDSRSYNGQGYDGQNYGGPVNDSRNYNGPGYDGRNNGGPGYDGRNYDGRNFGDQGRSGRSHGNRSVSSRRPADYGREDLPVRRKRKKWPIVLGVILALIIIPGIFLAVSLSRVSHVRLKELIVNAGVESGKDIKNVVLYGVDSREGKLTEECHSDTIIICSLNKALKEVRMVSVYRDTYLDNTNGEYRKATECYYFGGPERSVNMLNKNLDLDITDYITVDFSSVIKIVDLLGGIDLEITDEEMEYINGYCVENNLVTGVSYTPLTYSGYVHLDGIQALAYCRIRYTEGWDYKRTQRQRTVISLCYQKAKEQGLTALLSMINTLLPEIATNMSLPELLSLAKSIFGYQLSEETGFPFNQVAMDVDGSDVVVSQNLAQDVSQLHSFLFGAEGYTPSPAVQEISSYISSKTGLY